MNPIIFSILFILNQVAAWNWKGTNNNISDTCSAPKIGLNTTDMTWGVCLEAMIFKQADLSNVTAVFQPGFWEHDYSEISDFCSSKGNGTFCYRSQSQICNNCLDMAVVRCPEGIISSCRSNFICNELINHNVTCNSAVGSVFNTSYTESGQARCEAIEDVIQLPPAENVTTTIDQQNNTITVGSQVFGFPFVSTTTVDCTYTYLSALPSGFPQPTQVITACFNDSLSYDELLPKTTCAGPYPPGPMTTITENVTYSIIPPMESTIVHTGIIFNSSSSISSVFMPSSMSECLIESSMYSSWTSTSEYPTGSLVSTVTSTLIELSSTIIPILYPSSSSLVQNSITQTTSTLDTSIESSNPFESTASPSY